VAQAPPLLPNARQPAQHHTPMVSYTTADLREKINHRRGGEDSRTTIEHLRKRHRDIEGRNLEKDFGLHAPVCGGLVAQRDRGHGPITESSTTPQVGGNSDWVRRLRLLQEHGGRRAALAAYLPNHRQRQAVPRPNRRRCDLNLISLAAFKKLDISMGKLQPLCSFSGLGPVLVMPRGCISLPVMFGMAESFRMESVLFDIAEVSLPFNAILGRLAHYGYLVLKMPSPLASSGSGETVTQGLCAGEAPASSSGSQSCCRA
jgi:hypothetical protein